MNNEINAMAARIERNIVDARLNAAAERVNYLPSSNGRIRTWVASLRRRPATTAERAASAGTTSVAAAENAPAQGWSEIIAMSGATTVRG